ncbi:MAG: hypothetical protein HY308_17575 [Gammaproteobacteria bacterium]|nr:hypothetical protein [Gammaproteobacteria bacterium]
MPFVLGFDLTDWLYTASTWWICRAWRLVDQMPVSLRLVQFDQPRPAQVVHLQNEEELMVYCQPQVDLRNGRVFSAETLLR